MWSEIERDTVRAVLLGRWPREVAGWGELAQDAFLSELQADGLTAELAVRAARAHVSDFAPSAPTLSRLAERALQGPAPSFEAAQREIASRLSMLPSVAGREPARDAWPRFIARLGEHHEVTARYALALGPKGVRELPDPRHAHGAAIESARKMLARSVGDWDADPRRGVAAADAAGQLGAGVGGAIAAARAELTV